MSSESDSREDRVSDPAVALIDWPERPEGVIGDAAKQLGNMLLNHAVPAYEIVATLHIAA
ncbi:hypothetical protein [Subtercola frigoramans]|uniref:Uncharacterized protein n=1 Tax=Subtercola frigoramans TaxID=120298 RepID=A0ABS2L8E0_9MICO|nr:hypothetical protein [Subtercola frigoramans]MBM7473151.1 hypothetical protein [Subtercola frigoramans]